MPRSTCTLDTSLRAQSWRRSKCGYHASKCSTLLICHRISWVVTAGVLLLDMIKQHSTVSQQDPWVPHPHVYAQHQPEIIQLGSHQIHQEQWDTTTGASTPRSTAQPILPSPGEPENIPRSVSSHYSLTPESLRSGAPEDSSGSASEIERWQAHNNQKLYAEVKAVDQRRGSQSVATPPFFVPRRLQSLSELYVLNNSDSSRSVPHRSDLEEGFCDVPISP